MCEEYIVNFSEFMFVIIRFDTGGKTPPLQSSAVFYSVFKNSFTVLSYPSSSFILMRECAPRSK